MDNPDRPKKNLSSAGLAGGAGRGGEGGGAELGDGVGIVSSVFNVDCIRLPLKNLANRDLSFLSSLAKLFVLHTLVIFPSVVQ